MTAVLPQSDGAGVLKVFRYLVVEISLQSARGEVERLSKSLGVIDQASALDLAAQGSLADGFEAFREQRLRG